MVELVLSAVGQQILISRPWSLGWELVPARSAAYVGCFFALWQRRNLEFASAASQLP